MKHFDYMERNNEIYTKLLKEGEFSQAIMLADEFTDTEYEQFLNEINNWLKSLKYPYFLVNSIIDLWSKIKCINMVVKLDDIYNFLDYIAGDADNITIDFDNEKGNIKIKKTVYNEISNYTLYSLGNRTKEKLMQILLDMFDNNIEELQHKAKYYFSKPISRLTKSELIELLYKLYSHKKVNLVIL